MDFCGSLVAESGVEALLHGLYDDTLVRTPDGWKISQRTAKLVSAVVGESSQLSLVSAP
ncbi:nuclear transport factor 2 family protein [Streptomyces sp. NBC_00365]|uniref:hypothetical protein n=1 Tax=Streptomyces sp. NBC_00365 TaxID=2975726 RepID=UPI002258831F|nr:hypothetical protein [Streptomyces sp. NBC_00365]MCX5097595.1 nuclear transport factor 2 family protein [Streptomyces sp. NBC_00365]